MDAGFGSPAAIGELLLTKFLLPFEAASFLLLVAAVGAVVLARKRRGLEEQLERAVATWRGDGLMDTSWFVVLSAFIFAIGAAGVMTRRSPLVILLCLELMLNAGNLALIAFSRMLGNHDGQMFALIVMVVAACEVVVGLGIIVAMYRRRLPIDVDEMSELRGLNTTTYGWVVLGSPLAGTLLIALGWKRAAGRAGRLARQRCAIGVSFLAVDRDALRAAPTAPEESRSLVGTAFTYVDTAGLQADLAILVDPLSVLMCLVVSGVSFLIHLYSVAYMDSDRGYVRFFAYLNFFVFSMLLLVLASNFVLLIVGWAFVGAASYLLISFWYRRDTATAAGIKAFVINVIGDVGLVIGAFLLFDGTGALDYAGRVQRRAGGVRDATTASSWPPA